MASVVPEGRPRGPEARRLEQDLHAHRRHEGVVPGRLPVLPHAPGDVGGDVVLHQAAEDGDDLAVGAHAIRRRRLDALVGGLPWVQRAAVPHVARLLAGPVEVAIPIGQQRARRLRVRVDEEREHEDLGVPEDVQEVGHAAQTAGAHRHRVFGRVSRADHVVDAEAQGLLVAGVAVDDQVGVAPACVPRRAMTAEELVETELLRPRQRAARRVRGRHPGTRRDERRKPVHGGRVARLEAPADHVASLLHVAHDGRTGSRARRDREHVAAAVATLGASDEAGLVELLELGRLGRPAGVGHAHRAGPHDAPRSILGRRLGADREDLAVGHRGEARGAHAQRVAGTQPLAPVPVDDAVAHVEDTLVLEQLPVREIDDAAPGAQAEAGPVRRRDRLPKARLVGAVAEDAGHERGRRGHGGALLERPARAALAVGHRQPGLDLALAEGVEALDLETPGRVADRRGEARVRHALAVGQLVVKDAQELVWAAADVQHARRHPVGLHAHADEGGAPQLGDQA